MNWVNGAPYSCWTKTGALAEETCLHSSSSTIRVVLLLETSFIANVPYQWKIPLLLNPFEERQTFRMNLTLYTYSSGSARPQKELFL